MTNSFDHLFGNNFFGNNENGHVTSKKAQKRRRGRVLSIEELEPREMLDAGLVSALEDALLPPTLPENETVITQSQATLPQAAPTLAAAPVASGALLSLDPDTAPPQYKLATPKYDTTEAFVITYNIMDFQGADNTGQTDMAPLIKKLLGRMEGSSREQGGVNNGGILFLPEGTYRLDSNIQVPKGVTIRGEWQEPVPGEPIVGTIIKTDFGRGEETKAKTLFLLEPAAGIKDLSIWYPEQRADNIVPYPPSIGYGVSGYFGNEYAMAKNVTFVNSYSGAVLLEGGGAPNMTGLYGTPLNRGIEIDFIAEVGRVEGVHFSPDYWIGSGLEGAPTNTAAFKSWLRDNGTGINMRRNDWSYVTDMSVEGYNVGFRLAQTIANEDSAPNGQNYLMNFTDCETGIRVERISGGAGVMFHEVNMENCDYGVFVAKGGTGVLALSNTTIDASRYSIASDNGASTNILFNQSVIESGKIELHSGTLIMQDCDVDTKTEGAQIVIGQEARVMSAGNRFAEELNVDDRSLYESTFINTPLENYKEIPDFPYKKPSEITQRPERNVLYVATDYGVRANNSITKNSDWAKNKETYDYSFDNTQALQALLYRAGAEGGGIVYLPPGKYAIKGFLNIPSGVELQGATDIGGQPTGPGSVLEAFGGKDNPDAPPLITLQANSGVRGIVINYPDQVLKDLIEKGGDSGIIEPYVYPYAIRGAGSGVWIVNIGFRATYSGIDLFTYKCDDAYVEMPGGHFFTNGIRIGGETNHARIQNAQFNTIGYGAGDESKFGRWANSYRYEDVYDTVEEGRLSNMPAYQQNYRDLQFFILDDCTDTLLFNNFHFGSNIGTVFGSETTAPSGLAMGHGEDASFRSLWFNDLGPKGFDLVGSQIVSTPHKGMEGGETDGRYVVTDENFKDEVTLFNADFWGSVYYAVEANGGKVTMQAVKFNNGAASGENQFVKATDGELQLYGSYIGADPGRVLVDEGKEDLVTINHSLLRSGSKVPENSSKWFATNLNMSPKMIFDHVQLLDRTGWTVTASSDGNGEGDPQRVLDGNINTRWNHERGMQVGDWLALSRTDSTPFNTLLLDQGSSAGDYPRGYEIYISDDAAIDSNTDWGDPVLTGAGNQGVTFIRFPESITAKHIKIVVTVPDGLYWSMAELNAAVLTSDSPVLPEDV